MIFFLFFILLHGDHRPDENPERHKCHHIVLDCGKACETKCKLERGKCLDKCLNKCLAEYAICYNKFGEK